MEVWNSTCTVVDEPSSVGTALSTYRPLLTGNPFVGGGNSIL